METHSEISNRSLFKVFVDNLIYPSQIDKNQITLYGLSSPNNIKKDFAGFISRTEEVLKSNIVGMINENLVKCFVDENSAKR